MIQKSSKLISLSTRALSQPTGTLAAKASFCPWKIHRCGVSTVSSTRVRMGMQTMLAKDNDTVVSRNEDGSFVLNRSNFQKTVSLIALRVQQGDLGRVIKLLHGHLLNLPRQKNVVSDVIENDTNENAVNGNTKRVLLSQTIQTFNLDGLPESVLETLKQTETKIDPVQHSLTLNYDYFSAEEVLSKIIPEGVDVPTSFETVGHIAHLNLREPQLPYKHIIGEVLLEKNTRLRTIVNKTSNIATKFRTFPMEILAGDEDMNVEVQECKARFRFNYAEVYWNSRLQQEHLRVIRKCNSNDTICDMMCGVGPFSVPLGMKGCTVYANDLNPKSYEYLNSNLKLNKVASNVQTYNMDGRDFFNLLIDEGKKFNHVIMNLPAIALEFLDVFKGKFSKWEGPLPRIHCYCFSLADDPEEDVVKRTESILECKLDRTKVEVHNVRKVSPHKSMMCISFDLPEENARSDLLLVEAPIAKKARIEEP